MSSSVPPSHRAHSRLLLISVTVLLLSWGLFWLSSRWGWIWPVAGESPQQLRHSPHAVSARHDESLVIPAAVEPLPVRVAATSPSPVIIVRDESGSPIAGATAARCTAFGARNLSREARIGTTDSLGELSVAPPANRDDSILVISADGFVHCSIASPQHVGRYEVTLAQGSKMELHCHDFGGKAIPGIHVAVSKVAFPVLSIDDSPAHTWGPGSDAVTTIWHATSDSAGVVCFTGLLPGKYFIRASSKTHLLAAAGDDEMKIPLVGTFLRQVILCGTICVAALETNVPLSQIVSHQITDSPTHIADGFHAEALDLRRRDIETRFPLAQAMVSLATGEANSIGTATFRYSTLGYGDIVYETPFVSMASFEKPVILAAKQANWPPSGEVLIRVEGDFAVSRNRARVFLKRSAQSSDGILCIENQAKKLPVGTYFVEINHRELAMAIDEPAPIEVTESAQTMVVLKIRDGLVPVTVNLDVPAVLKGQHVSIAVYSLDKRVRAGRTMSDRWITWVSPGPYEINAETVGCKPSVTEIAVRHGEPSSVLLHLETNK